MHFWRNQRIWSSSVSRQKGYHFYRHLLIFNVLYFANLFAIGQQNGITWRNMIDISFFLPATFPILVLDVSFGIRDLNWHVRISCKIPVRFSVGKWCCLETRELLEVCLVWWNKSFWAFNFQRFWKNIGTTDLLLGLKQEILIKKCAITS